MNPRWWSLHAVEVAIADSVDFDLGLAVEAYSTSTDSHIAIFNSDLPGKKNMKVAFPAHSLRIELT